MVHNSGDATARNQTDSSLGGYWQSLATAPCVGLLQPQQPTAPQQQQPHKRVVLPQILGEIVSLSLSTLIVGAGAGSDDNHSAVNN